MTEGVGQEQGWVVQRRRGRMRLPTAVGTPGVGMGAGALHGAEAGLPRALHPTALALGAQPHDATVFHATGQAGDVPRSQCALCPLLAQWAAMALHS